MFYDFRISPHQLNRPLSVWFGLVWLVFFFGKLLVQKRGFIYLSKPFIHSVYKALLQSDQIY